MSEHTNRQPIANSPLSLVLVAHNVASDIESVITQWITQLNTRTSPWEIIIVDDGSTDETPASADTLAQRDDRLRVTHFPMQTGFGASLRSGIEMARYPLLGFCTCDRQYEPAELKRLLAQIDKVDLVTGYRQWLPVPTPLRWLGRIWRLGLRVMLGASPEPLPCWLGDNGQRKRWLARWVFGVRVRDVDCAFRLYRREVFQRLPIQSNGPFAQTEILAKANFLGCLMSEVAVTYHPPSGAAIHGSLDPQETYLSEAYRVFGHATLGVSYVHLPRISGTDTSETLVLRSTSVSLVQWFADCSPIYGELC